MNINTAYAPDITVKRFGGALHIYDAAAGVTFDKEVKVGQVDIIRGFIHYTGAKGTAHEGITAVIRPVNGDPMLTLENELRAGIRDGRDDRN